jgi:hypothetical protein
MCYKQSVGILAIAAAFLPSLACNAMARGVGQGEHEADSGGGVPFGGGYTYSGGVGQGQYGAGGAYGAAVPSGINSLAVGQAQHEAQGYYYSPGFEANSRSGTRNIAASQPRRGCVVVSDPHYRYANGVWFYQMPDNSWMRWENGTWVNANQTATVRPNVGPIAGHTAPHTERR